MYVFHEFPKCLYKKGAPCATANDEDEQQALLKEGYELPPSNEVEAPPCKACTERDATIAERDATIVQRDATIAALRNQLKALEAKITPPPPLKPPVAPKPSVKD